MKCPYCNKEIDSKKDICPICYAAIEKPTEKKEDKK